MTAHRLAANLSDGVAARLAGVANILTIVGAAFLVLTTAVAPVPVAESQDETPYVPTPQNVVNAMLEIAAVRDSDLVMDLGSGDGRIVITAAAKYGARGVGVDYDGWLINESRANAAKAGVADRVTLIQKDIREVDFHAATVLTMYLLPEFNLELRPKILFQLRAGARVVSHDWDMGDWEPDAKVELPAPDKTVGANRSSIVYLWIVPARVAGRWRTQIALGGRVADVELDVTQRFQRVAGTATIDGVKTTLESGRVTASWCSFVLRTALAIFASRGASKTIASPAALRRPMGDYTSGEPYATPYGNLSVSSVKSGLRCHTTIVTRRVALRPGDSADYTASRGGIAGRKPRRCASENRRCRAAWPSSPSRRVSSLTYMSTKRRQVSRSIPRL